MLYFIYGKLLNGKGEQLQAVANAYGNEEDKQLVRRVRERDPCLVRCRCDFHTFDMALTVAEEATKLTGDKYVASDEGPYISPRYDVIKAPKVGEPVSYAFNGDSYPCGHITKVSESLRRVEATDENGNVRVFIRRRVSSAWKHQGTWSMVHGHEYKQNPSF